MTYEHGNSQSRHLHGKTFYVIMLFVIRKACPEIRCPFKGSTIHARYIHSVYIRCVTKVSLPDVKHMFIVKVSHTDLR